MNYRPYIWMGDDDQNAHVRDFHRLEHLETLRNAQGGGIYRLQEMARLSQQMPVQMATLATVLRDG